MPEMPVCPDCTHRHKDYEHVCGHVEELAVAGTGFASITDQCICSTRQEGGA